MSNDLVAYLMRCSECGVLGKAYNKRFAQKLTEAHERGHGVNHYTIVIETNDLSANNTVSFYEINLSHEEMKILMEALRNGEEFV
jgi:hypothetical protein